MKTVSVEKLKQRILSFIANRHVGAHLIESNKPYIEITSQTREGIEHYLASPEVGEHTLKRQGNIHFKIHNYL